MLEDELAGGDRGAKSAAYWATKPADIAAIEFQRAAKLKVSLRESDV